MEGKLCALLYLLNFNHIHILLIHIKIRFALCELLCSSSSLGLISQDVTSNQERGGAVAAPLPSCKHSCFCKYTLQGNLTKRPAMPVNGSLY